MKRKIYCMAFAALIVFAAQAEVYFVAPVARGNGNGTSWENAMAPTDQLLNGDVVYFSEGNYKLAPFALLPGVTYKGGFSEKATGTDVSDYDPQSYITKLAPQNEGLLFSITGDDRATETILAGLTIADVTGNQTAETGSVLYAENAFVTMRDVTVTENKTAFGGIIVSKNSVIRCEGCVFSNNLQTVDAENIKSGKSPILFSLLSSSKAVHSSLFMERCAIYGNTFMDFECMAKASEGGLIYGAKPCDVVLVNNFIDGNGLRVKNKAGFLRTAGGSAAASPSIAVLAYNTIYNFSTLDNHPTGSVITIGAQYTSFLAGNIMATPDDYRMYEYGTVDTDPNIKDAGLTNSNLSLTEGTTSNQALAYGNSTGAVTTLWLGAGANLVAGRTMINKGNYWVLDSWAISKEFEKGDNWKVNNQYEIFGDNEAFIDGRNSFIKPLDNVGANTADSQNILKAWPEFTNFLGTLNTDGYLSQTINLLPQIDLTVDCFGNKRGDTTWSGCYDHTAAFAGVNEIVYDAQEALEIVSLGGGRYAVKGVTGVADVYDMSGRCVATGNGMIDLSTVSAGVYVVKAGGAFAKILR